MFNTKIKSVQSLCDENKSIYLHHRTATKICNLAEIRNSINALKVRKL